MPSNPGGADELAVEVVRDGTTSTPFLFKLWSMLEDPDYAHAISWNNEIRGFTVHNIDLLLSQFQSRQFSFFHRQLNYFSFNKVGKQKNITLPRSNCRCAGKCSADPSKQTRNHPSSSLAF